MASGGPQRIIWKFPLKSKASEGFCRWSGIQWTVWMYKLSTAPWRLATVLLVFVAPWRADAQPAPAVAAPGLTPDWQRIGNLVLDQALAGPASGPCKRVWYG